MPIWNLRFSYLISNVNRVNYHLLKPIFKFRKTFYSEPSINAIIFSLVYILLSRIIDSECHFQYVGTASDIT